MSLRALAGSCNDASRANRVKPFVDRYRSRYLSLNIPFQILSYLEKSRESFSPSV
jgi:hypothetical protein